jgi:alpha-ketoglutarate-dependent taurine dioxygenase
MKVSKIPGCGSKGVFIDDVDFDNLTDEEWMAIGQIHLDELVTIIRGTNLDKHSYFKWMNKWGHDRLTYFGMLFKKYPDWSGSLDEGQNNPDWDEHDRESIKFFRRVRVEEGRELGNIIKVSGMKDDDGNPTGMFAEGELLWHSNESGNIAFTAGVALLGYQGTTKSATGFLTTTDYYEDVSESFRSELDDMVLLHNFTPGKINPGLRDVQDNLMYKNMAPEPNAEIPMVIKSPAGHTGLHYSFNTVVGIKDMKADEATKLLEKIRSELEVEKYMYDHWYQQDGDLCLFDNSITQHRRLGTTENRLCYRYQYDYTNLQDGPYVPYVQQPYINQYIERVTLAAKAQQIEPFKFPNPKDYA